MPNMFLYNLSIPLNGTLSIEKKICKKYQK